MTATRQPERPERREEQRFSVPGPLGDSVMVFLPIAITEFDRGGVQVETPFAFQIDSVHELRLALGNQPVVVKGRVTHCSVVDVAQESMLYRTGLEFVDLPDRLADVIASFVERVKSEQRR